jgi:ubiquinone/menaquinone biosynthesis C-methylase UbiE
LRLLDAFVRATLNDPHIDDESALLRTLEPETMDDVREVQEYQAMDHQEVNERFVDDLISSGPVGPRVVDLGCGTAAIPVILCQKRDDVEVLGVDASIAMLEAARIEIELGGVQGRVHLEHADCKELAGYQSGMADTVISNTVLHHLAEPGQMLAQAIRILAPGGRLFIRDLVRPADADAVEQLVSKHAGSASDFAQQLLRQSLHASLTVSEAADILTDLGVEAALPRLSSDRHWTFDWVAPS